MLVSGPTDGAKQWNVHSGDLAEVLGVGAGWAAEEIVRELLATHAAYVVERVDFDSYDVVFSAYTDDEATARQVAGIVRRAAELSAAAQDAARGSSGGYS